MGEKGSSGAGGRDAAKEKRRRGSGGVDWQTNESVRGGLGTALGKGWALSGASQ